MSKLDFVHERFLNEEIVSIFIEKEQIGEIKIEYQDRDIVYICGIEIEDKYRGKGYGREIVEHMEKYLLSNNIIKIYLSPNTFIAEKFWQHMGYLYDEDEQMIMSKVLR